MKVPSGAVVGMMAKDPRMTHPLAVVSTTMQSSVDTPGASEDVPQASKLGFQSGWPEKGLVQPFQYHSFPTVARFGG